MPDFQSILYMLDLIGVAVFAVSGALAAGKKRLDLLGVMVIAIVTAIGGGTIRDVLLNQTTVFWIRNPIYLIIIVLSAGFTIIYTRFRKPPIKALLIADAFGLGLFTISGAQIAEQTGFSWPIIILMGTITGTAGGMIRDVLMSEIPQILTKGNIYATASIVGVSIYLLLQFFGVDSFICSLLGMVFIISLRLAAITWNLSLPVFVYDDRPKE